MQILEAKTVGESVRITSENGVYDERTRKVYSEIVTKKNDEKRFVDGLEVKQIDEHQHEVIKDEKPLGDYTNPILLTADGMNVEQGLWYYVTDKDMPKEATCDAFCSAEDFEDETWFK